MISIDDDDGVRLVTWRRPEALNAMSLDLWDATRDALATAADDGARCVVVTGEGRGFTVGQDLSEMTDPRHSDPNRGFRGLMSALTALEVPLVAAVNGMAVGFGTTLLPWCDIVLAGASARFRIPFVSLGVTFEAGSSVTLSSVMGAQATADFVLTGRWMDAEEAADLSLVRRVVPDDELLAAALDMAAAIAAQPPNALRATTALLRHGHRVGWLDAIERENEHFATLAGGDENLAAIDAFFSRG